MNLKCRQISFGQCILSRSLYRLCHRLLCWFFFYLSADAFVAEPFAASAASTHESSASSPPTGNRGRHGKTRAGPNRDRAGQRPMSANASTVSNSEIPSAAGGGEASVSDRHQQQRHRGRNHKRPENVPR
jgi:hypothetical protein